MVSLDRMEVGKGGVKCALEEVHDLYGFETNAIVTMEEVTNISIIKNTKERSSSTTTSRKQSMHITHSTAQNKRVCCQKDIQEE